MALKSTIFKTALNVADLDRHYYGDFKFTIARHPSETDERMMLRIMAFALHAHEQMEFGTGISTDDEPDLWQKSLSGEIEHWIDLGTPEVSRIKKACGRAEQVTLYCYGGRSVDIWWDKRGIELHRFNNLRVFNIDLQSSSALAAMAAASMKLQATIQDGELLLSGHMDGDFSIQIQPVPLMS